jgi:Flp pilus assembly protein TadG
MTVARKMTGNVSGRIPPPLLCRAVKVPAPVLAPVLAKVLASMRSCISGAVSVEFALVAPVLGLMVMAAADFGTVMYEKQRISNAARAGAQYAALNTTNAQNDAGIQAAVANSAQRDADEFTITTNYYCQCFDGSDSGCNDTCEGNDTPEVYIDVTVEYELETIFTYPGLSNPMGLSAQSIFRLR